MTKNGLSEKVYICNYCNVHARYGFKTCYLHRSGLRQHLREYYKQYRIKRLLKS